MSAGGGHFLVTTSTGTRKSDASRTLLWDGKRPLGLGHPLRWVLERAPDGGIRVRDLKLPSGPALRGPMQAISADMIAKGSPVALPQAGRMTLSVREAPVVAPVYAPTGRPGRNIDRSATLRVHVCAGNWVIESHAVGSQFTGRTRAGADVFVVNGLEGELRVDAKIPGVRLTIGAIDDERGASRDVSVGQALRVPGDRIDSAIVSHGGLDWRFSRVAVPAPLPGIGSEAVEPDVVAFKRSLRFSLAGLAAFVVMAWLWPKPQPPEELVPAQFAKVVMSKPKAQVAQSAPAAAPAGEKNKADKDKKEEAPAAKRAEKAAVVQAFRAKALSNAVSGLLKGGMTSLLAQSDFSSATASRDARQMLDSKSSAMGGVGKAGPVKAGNVQVAALGGGGIKGGLGYGKGEKAGVSGQGKGFVSMDVGGATVEEGLTKDEVGEVIHRHASEIRYCYESAMLRTPDLEGKLTVYFVIGPNGKVKTAQNKGSNLPDPRLDDCVLRRLVTWKFPLPKGGVEVPVTYPFVFKTLGR